jgi:hypothetical protein
MGLRRDDMGFGNTASKRRQAAKKHANRIRKCKYCGKEIKGNGFYMHKQACEKINPSHKEG